MLFEKVVHSLEELVATHHKLIDLSEEKTELIKDGKVDELQAKVLAERKLVLQLEQEEKNRHEIVKAWFSSSGKDTKEQTITSMLTMLEDEEDQSRLAETTRELTEAIVKLKRSEQLNQELLEQSMQFVQMSLHLLNPTLKDMNYGEKDSEVKSRHSIFDSRA